MRASAYRKVQEHRPQQWPAAQVERVPHLLAGQLLDALPTETEQVGELSHAPQLVHAREPSALPSGALPSSDLPSGKALGAQELVAT